MKITENNLRRIIKNIIIESTEEATDISIGDRTIEYFIDLAKKGKFDNQTKEEYSNFLINNEGVLRDVLHEDLIALIRSNL